MKKFIGVKIKCDIEAKRQQNKTCLKVGMTEKGITKINRSLIWKE